MSDFIKLKIMDQHDKFQGFFWVAALFIMNVINYIDRLSVAGIQREVLITYGSNSDRMGGFLQTIYVLFYTAFAIPCGYIAERYSRKYLILTGLCAWSASVFASSFIPSDKFALFLLLRGIGGVGEASFSVAAPTIISDLFSPEKRNQILMITYFAIPLGSGIGYGYGAKILADLGSWQWAFRITPIFGIAIIILLCTLLREPRRVISTESLRVRNNTSYLHDLRYLLQNKSFLWLCIAYSSMMFVVGTIAWFTPNLIIYATCIQENITDVELLSDDVKTSINWTYAGITAIGGLVGIAFGVWLTRIWKSGSLCLAGCATYKSDAYVAVLGSFGAVPFFAIAYAILPNHILLAWILIFIGFTFLCFNWAIIIDFLLYVVSANHHNVATSWFFLLAHLLGDASGPFAVGALADFLRAGEGSPKDYFRVWTHLFQALNALLALSGVTFLFAAFTAPSSPITNETTIHNGSANFDGINNPIQ